MWFAKTEKNPKEFETQDCPQLFITPSHPRGSSGSPSTTSALCTFSNVFKNIGKNEYP